MGWELPARRACPESDTSTHLRRSAAFICFGAFLVVFRRIVETAFRAGFLTDAGTRGAFGFARRNAGARTRVFIVANGWCAASPRARGGVGLRGTQTRVYGACVEGARRAGSVLVRGAMRCARHESVGGSGRIFRQGVPIFGPYS